MDQDTIKNKLLEHFSDADIIVRDLTGTKDHWQVEITSGRFEGKSLVEQHQLVYQALKPWINKEIHALAIQTHTKNT